MASTDSELLKGYLLLENQVGTPQKPPKFMTLDDNFIDFKWRFMNFISLTETDLMRCFEVGPHVPTTRTDAGEQPKAPENYDQDDLDKLAQNKKAFLLLTVCLSNEITERLRQHRSAKGLWEALVEMVEGNAEVRENKKALLKEEFNMFNHRQGEAMLDLVKRFEKLMVKVRAAGVNIPNTEVSHKLMNSLPYS
ncbi:uncharacterized protein LOC143588357 [Bidens hawaiensis]|uniref:uncharacterized protein LOC143560166 n=1 Tax=Bidens hawaiensis TaxID=980011 RepID=UPI0040495D67